MQEMYTTRCIQSKLSQLTINNKESRKYLHHNTKTIQNNKQQTQHGGYYGNNNIRQLNTILLEHRNRIKSKPSDWVIFF